MGGVSSSHNETLEQENMRIKTNLASLNTTLSKTQKMLSLTQKNCDSLKSEKEYFENKLKETDKKIKTLENNLVLEQDLTNDLQKQITDKENLIQKYKEQMKKLDNITDMFDDK